MIIIIMMMMMMMMIIIIIIINSLELDGIQNVSPFMES